MKALSFIFYIYILIGVYNIVSFIFSDRHRGDETREAIKRMNKLSFVLFIFWAVFTTPVLYVVTFIKSLSGKE